MYIFNENNYSSENSISSQHNSNINKLILLKDSRILTCSDDNHINIFEPNSYKCLNYKFSFSLNNDYQVKTILQAKNYQIISGDVNGRINIWTPQNIGNYIINNTLFDGSVIINEDEKEMVPHSIFLCPHLPVDNFIFSEGNAQLDFFCKIQKIFSRGI